MHTSKHSINVSIVIIVDGAKLTTERCSLAGFT